MSRAKHSRRPVTKPRFPDQASKDPRRPQLVLETLESCLPAVSEPPDRSRDRVAPTTRFLNKSIFHHRETTTPHIRIPEANQAAENSPGHGLADPKAGPNKASQVETLLTAVRGSQPTPSACNRWPPNRSLPIQAPRSVLQLRLLVLEATQ